MHIESEFFYAPAAGCVMTKKDTTREACSSKSGWRYSGFHLWLSEVVFSLTPCSVFWLIVLSCAWDTIRRHRRGEESTPMPPMHMVVWEGAMDLQSHFCPRTLLFYACLFYHHRPKTCACTWCRSGALRTGFNFVWCWWLSGTDQTHVWNQTGCLMSVKLLTYVELVGLLAA